MTLHHTLHRTVQVDGLDIFTVKRVHRMHRQFCYCMGFQLPLTCSAISFQL